MLDKIEALLRKAESTQFEAEAATFYAKAQELMEKYAITEESLWKIDPSKIEKPIFETVTIKGDSTHDKFSLLTVIAACNRCQAWHDSSSPKRKTRGGGFTESRTHYNVTIAGYPSDITFVTMLYSSLMLQLDLACVIAEVEAEEEIESIRSWRISFTDGFCDRIDVRLQAQYLRRQGESKSTDIVLAREAKVKEHIEQEGIFFSDFDAPNRINYDGAAFEAGDKAGSNADIGNERLPNKRKELA